MTAPALHPHLLRLSALIDLERRAREALPVELPYLMVNDTLTVVPYQQAAFWRRGKVAAVSGVATADESGPYHRWLARILAAAAKFREPRPVDAATLGADAADWDAWFPPVAFWVPLADRGGNLVGGLLFGRHDDWHEAEIHLLTAVCGTYALCLAVAERRPRRLHHWHDRRRWLWAACVVAAVGASMLPIRASVLAPADIVAAEPFAVRAPFDGVVDTIRVAPNAVVHKGDVLLTLDTTERQAKADVAQKALEMSRAEYAEAQQQAMTDARSKGRLAILQSKVEQAEVEYSYDRGMLQRAAVVAPADGVAVFDDPHEWIGRPVTLGERIMVVATPMSQELDIAVPVSDAVTFQQGADVTFFPNVMPDNPWRGHLRYASYSSAPSPDGVLSYQFRAQLDDPPGGLRLGLKGTAKVFGPREPFALWALRRPIAVVRAWLSL
jgi:multidrug efflux pump subunit AcrA (membrane-fusion protein)